MGTQNLATLILDKNQINIGTVQCQIKVLGDYTLGVGCVQQEDSGGGGGND